jgi:hypothetical protein
VSTSSLIHLKGFHYDSGTPARLLFISHLANLQVRRFDGGQILFHQILAIFALVFGLPCVGFMIKANPFQKVFPNCSVPLWIGRISTSPCGSPWNSTVPVINDSFNLPLSFTFNDSGHGWRWCLARYEGSKKRHVEDWVNSGHVWCELQFMRQLSNSLKNNERSQELRQELLGTDSL